MSKRRQIFSYMLALLVVPVMLVSCSSTKKVKDDNSTLGGTTAFHATTFFDNVIANKATAECITSRIKARLVSDSKNMSTGGTLRMKRGEVIQISLVDPILGVAEVARLEFNKDRVLFIDRLNRRYAEVSYDNVDFLHYANVDFNSLQSLFWSEVFKPGADKMKASDFVITKTDESNVNIDYKDKVLNYQFVTLLSDALLKQTRISAVNASGYALSFDYDNHVEFDGKKFPKDIHFSFTSGGKTGRIELQLSSISQNSNWTTRTPAPSDKYTKVSAEGLLKSLTR